MGDLAIGQIRAVAPRSSAQKLAADPPRVPSHVAIIMDGNGRWATARGLPRVAGHRAGVQAVRRTIEAAITHGVSWLTLYAFSSENWARPAAEVSDLTGLLRRFIKSELAELGREGVRLRFIGDRGRFDQDIQNELTRSEAATQGNTRLNLVIALSYGGRGEIVDAVKSAIAAAAAGTLDAATLTEAGFARLLSTREIPDPDVILRTSGEQRLSNFLLWQSAYAELIFNEVLWPDFTTEHFEAAIAEFGRRERRFGARPA